MSQGQPAHKATPLLLGTSQREQITAAQVAFAQALGQALSAAWLNRPPSAAVTKHPCNRVRQIGEAKKISDRNSLGG